ncbi:glycosyltransferase family 1 protein [Thermodesulfovibrio sp. 1176]|uniref:glycosyltransferase family 4 protein n=1 Tax=Thermodesulfovibrio sp. 1176 TaxID=3043424 RepID=UPI0024824768|nr:glycosyltransferase family 1 protein [Thermodesulfovibrio sp. 1176]MDI1472960.1 glycosyltransferase family 1 protein [Thermodesulfovibrio sp. 1176]
MIIDITRLIGRTLKGYQPTGIDRVCIEYLSYFRDKTKTSLFLFNRLWVINERLSTLLIDKIVSSDKEGLKKVLPLIPFNLTDSVEGELFFNLSHSGGLEKENYSKVLKKYNLKSVFMVHDLIPLEHPELVRDKENQKHKTRIENILALHDLILVNSYQTKQKLIEYAEDNLKLPVDIKKIEVNYLGLSSKFIETPDIDFSYVKEKFNLKDKYFVVLSTIEPRKNHLILFYAWKALHSLLKERTPQLVLIGRRGWENEQVIDFIERSSISNFIREIGLCNDLELKALLKNSQALLMPSIDEGFGLPVLEAIMLDIPVICSNISTFVELFKDIPIYCNWNDASDWVDTVLQILMKSKDSFIAEQIQRKKRNLKYIGKYSWNYHFYKLREALLDHSLIDSTEEIFAKEVNKGFVLSEQH